MDIKERIKRELGRRQKLREVNNYDPDLQPNNYELEDFLRKSGYKLEGVYAVKDSDIPELIISPVKDSYLYPYILHDIADTSKFTIEVIKYGFLEASDLEGVIQGYTNALAVVKYLDSLDLSLLEVEDEE